MKRLVAPLAVGMAALYLVLAISATWCLSLHATPLTPAHQHSKCHVTHSGLCAWACQANPAVTVLSVVPSAAVLEFVALLLLLVLALDTRFSAAGSLSRAPPDSPAL
jgi:hypothetical protein